MEILGLRWTADGLRKGKSHHSFADAARADKKEIVEVVLLYCRADKCLCCLLPNNIIEVVSHVLL